MNLSPHDFLEVGLRKAKGKLQACINSARTNGLVIYVPDQQNGIHGTFPLDTVLFRHIDNALSQIDAKRWKEVDEAGCFSSQHSYDLGLQEVALKKKLAHQLGYESFSDIPRKA